MSWLRSIRLKALFLIYGRKGDTWRTHAVALPRRRWKNSFNLLFWLINLNWVRSSAGSTQHRAALWEETLKLDHEKCESKHLSAMRIKSTTSSPFFPSPNSSQPAERFLISLEALVDCHSLGRACYRVALFIFVLFSYSAHSWIVPHALVIDGKQEIFKSHLWCDTDCGRPSLPGRFLSRVNYRGELLWALLVALCVEFFFFEKWKRFFAGFSRSVAWNAINIDFLLGSFFFVFV